MDIYFLTTQINVNEIYLYTYTRPLVSFAGGTLIVFGKLKIIHALIINICAKIGA